MNGNPKISIIVPCYNIANYLPLCLASITTQPTGKVEYLFVNDGSTDETLSLLTDFCTDKPYCYLINQCNTGVSGARNAALEIARGEYIYLLDGDDILTDGAIFAMLECIENASVDIILSEVTLLKDGIPQRIKLPMRVGEYTPDALYHSCCIFPTMPQLLYKRAIIETNHIRFNREICLGEVYEFTVKVLAKSSKIKVTSDCFFYYVMRSSSATHKPNFLIDLTVIDTLKQYELHSNGLSRYTSFQVTAFKMLMSFTYNKYAKLGLDDKTTVSIVRKFLHNPLVHKCITKVAYAQKVPIKERILALYILLSGILGYKILSKVLKYICRI